MRKLKAEMSDEESEAEGFDFRESMESKLYRKFLVKWGKVWKEYEEEEKNMIVKNEEERFSGCDKIHEIRENKIFDFTHK